MRRCRSLCARLLAATCGPRGARRIAIVCLGASLAGAFAETGSAQPPRTKPASYTREQTREELDDLINVYMDQSSRRNAARRALSSAATTLTAEMKAVRPLIQDFATSIAELNYALNDEQRRTPNIRPLYTDSLKVSALAVSVEKHGQKFNDHRLLMDEFQELDGTWRELAYRLDAVRNLRPEIRKQVADLNDLDEQIRDAIGIRPQLNRQEISRKTNDLAQDLRNLMDDIRDELGDKESRPYLISLGKARQSVLNLSSFLQDDTADVDLILDEYKQFQSTWYPQRAKLQEFDSRYFERSLRRITQADGEIHQLLLLPTKIDNQQLVYLTSALRKDIDEFFDRMSLKLLMHLPKADRVAGVASEFYGVCDHFIDEVKSNADYDQLVDSFQYIEQAQRSFSSVFGEVESDEAIAALRQIEQTISTLRSSLQVGQNDIDRQAAIDIAASAETVAEQLEIVAKRWLARDRQPFASACLQAIGRMRDDTAQLHMDLVSGVSAPQLRRQIDDIYETWREVYGYLVKCQSEDRANLGRLSSRMTPALVELRTMLSQ